MRRWVWILLLSASAVAATGMCIGLVRTVFPRVSEETVPMYSYSMTADASYQVHLIPNSLYPEGVLEEGRLYAKSLVDQIQVTFSSDFLGDGAADIGAVYSVDAVVQGYQSTDNSRQVVYERTYPLVPETTVTDKTENKLSQTVSLGLDTYLNFTDQAEQLLNTKLSKEVDILFQGTYTARTEYGTAEEPFSISVQIPLGSDLFTITKGEPLSQSNAITDTQAIRPTPSGWLITLFSAGIFAAAAAALFLIFFSRLPTAQESDLARFRTIRKKYGSRMLRLLALPTISANALREVDSPEGLARIADERRQFICWVPDEDGLPVDRLLFVPDGNDQLYILRLKS